MLGQGFDHQSCSGISANLEWVAFKQVDEAIVIHKFIADVSRNKNK
jgi:hypothetical protein